jgi:hypothetical protein
MYSKTQTEKGQHGLCVRTTILRSQVTDAMVGLAPVQAQQSIEDLMQQKGIKNLNTTNQFTDLHSMRMGKKYNKSVHGSA